MKKLRLRDYALAGLLFLILSVGVADASETAYPTECDGAYTLTTVPASGGSGLYVTVKGDVLSSRPVAGGIEIRHGLDVQVWFVPMGEQTPVHIEYVQGICWETASEASSTSGTVAPVEEPVPFASTPKVAPSAPVVPTPVVRSVGPMRPIAL